MDTDEAIDGGKITYSENPQKWMIRVSIKYEHGNLIVDIKSLETDKFLSTNGKKGEAKVQQHSNAQTWKLIKK